MHLTSGGAVKCWGGNSSGQLGNGSTTNSATAVDVVGLASGVTAIAAGASYICALTSAGGVECWGGGSGIPVAVAGLTSGVSSVHASPVEFTCVIGSSGGVRCWAGTSWASAKVQDVPGLAGGISAIAIGSQSTQCALRASGGVTCYAPGGTWTDVAGLSATSAGGSAPPTTGATGNTTAIAIGLQHACVITSAGGVKCWGYNSAGELGNGTTTQSDTPVDVVTLTSGVTAIAAGFGYSCAVAGGSQMLG